MGRPMLTVSHPSLTSKDERGCSGDRRPGGHAQRAAALL